MKRNDLIELLKTIPEDAEIVSVSGDDILGDYSFNTELFIIPTTALKSKKGTIWTKYSNYGRVDDEQITVWEIC